MIYIYTIIMILIITKQYYNIITLNKKYQKKMKIFL
jgi:hypothetical protein